MTITPPAVILPLAENVRLQNLIPIQSATLSVTSTSGSVTFTNIPSTNRVTFLLSNTGTSTAYIAAGKGSATAVAGSSTPSPASGNGVMSNAYAVPAGLTIPIDYSGNIDTIAAICSGSNTTTLEISICM